MSQGQQEPQRTFTEEEWLASAEANRLAARKQSNGIKTDDMKAWWNGLSSTAKWGVTGGAVLVVALAGVAAQNQGVPPEKVATINSYSPELLAEKIGCDMNTYHSSPGVGVAQLGYGPTPIYNQFVCYRGTTKIAAGWVLDQEKAKNVAMGISGRELMSVGHWVFDSTPSGLKAVKKELRR